MDKKYIEFRLRQALKILYHFNIISIDNIITG